MDGRAESGKGFKTQNRTWPWTQPELGLSPNFFQNGVEEKGRLKQEEEKCVLGWEMGFEWN